MQNLYTADITSAVGWDILINDSLAYLIDVRTSAEWHFTGVPLLPPPVSSRVLFIEWRKLPNMDINKDFIDLVSKFILDKQDSKILLLCRTGKRSSEAAASLTQHGYQHCYNISDGFEGVLDDCGHRGNVSGWKALELPWRQD